MKRISVYFLFFCLLSNYIYTQDTVTVYYDEEWKVISDKNAASYYRKAYSENNDVWVVRDYYISDTIQMDGLFIYKYSTKVKNGHFTYYYENGQKKSEGIYVKNKQNNKWIYWHENGQKKSEGAYKKGKKDSMWNYWYESGQKKAGGVFSKDRKESEWNYWYEIGKLKSTEIFKHGLIISDVDYFENGRNSYQGNYLHGRKHGKWTYWNNDGRITLEGNYKNGLKEGEWIRYFHDSDMKIFYINGVVDGKHFGSIIRRE